MEGQSKTVLLADLPANELLVGPGPEPEVVESIRAFGLINPLILIDEGDGYTVVAGRRRIKALRQLEETSAPARIFRGMTPLQVQSLIIAEQANRRENPASDLEAIDKLIEQGATDSAIAKATGLSIQTIRQRLKLHSLVPSLFEAFRQGKIRVSVAERAATLPVDLIDQAESLKSRIERAFAGLPVKPLGLVDGADCEDAVRQVRKRGKGTIMRISVPSARCGEQHAGARCCHAIADSWCALGLLSMETQAALPLAGGDWRQPHSLPTRSPAALSRTCRTL